MLRLASRQKWRWPRSGRIFSFSLMNSQFEKTKNWSWKKIKVWKVQKSTFVGGWGGGGWGGEGERQFEKSFYCQVSIYRLNAILKMLWMLLSFDLPSHNSTLLATTSLPSHSLMLMMEYSQSTVSQSSSRSTVSQFRFRFTISQQTNYTFDLPSHSSTFAQWPICLG